MFNRATQRRKQDLKKKQQRGAGKKHRNGMIEPLETRRLLTTLYGGGTGKVATYFYNSEGSTLNNMEIDIYGDVTAEFIFLDVVEPTVPNGLPTTKVLNRDVTISGGGGFAGIGSESGTTGFISDQTDGPIGTSAGADLFAIYVSKSDINSYIAITPINPTTGAELPFAGAGPGIKVDSANGRPGATTAAGPAGAGSGILGAIGANTAIIKTDINGAAIGVRPAGLDDLPGDANDLSAGLRVANGQDLGKFLFAGTVFGQVHVDGSMNVFYAGWILTGDARGASDGFGTASGLPEEQSESTTITSTTILTGSFGPVVPRNNFYVGGDLHDLVTVGPIGWDGTYGIGANPGPFFVSGTDIYVGGRLGNVQSNAGSAASIHAANLTPGPTTFTRRTVVQEEIEGFNHTGTDLGGLINSSGGAIITFPNTPLNGDFTAGVLLQLNTGRSTVPFTNDDFDSFQFLGSFSGPDGTDLISVIGSVDSTANIDRDPVDYYGVALMAGQTIRLQLIGSAASHVGVFDPDGRLVASDYDDALNALTGISEEFTGNLLTSTATGASYFPFSFTADRPGIYRFAVDESNSGNFVGTGNVSDFEQYQLTIAGVGNTAVGGVKALGPILDISDAEPAFRSDSGDFGGIYSTSNYRVWASDKVFIPQSPAAPNSVTASVLLGSTYVLGGNLRAIDAAGIGGAPLTVTTITNTTDGSTTVTSAAGDRYDISSGPDLYVPNGSIGLIQSRGTVDALAAGGAEVVAGQLVINPSTLFNFSPATLTTGSLGGATPQLLQLSQVSIGGNYQLINAGTVFLGGVVANGGLGTLRAGSMASLNIQTSYINLDADNTGFDGKCDLIDVNGNFGSLDVGGPTLIHGPGGNFRYLRVTGEAFTDPFFGGGSTQRVEHDYGETVLFTDDSGSTITLSPTGPTVVNSFFNANDPSTGPLIVKPRLSTRTYPVRSGGVIVMDVSSTESLAISGAASGSSGTAEVSRVEVHGAGTAVSENTTFVGRITTPSVSAVSLPRVLTQAQQLTVAIGGTAVVDVAYIGVLQAEADLLTGGVPVSSVTAFGNATSITNSTAGEIVTVQAESIGTLYSHGTIGLAKSFIAGGSTNFIQSLVLGDAYAARQLDSPTEMPVNPTGVDIGNTYPFQKQTFGITVWGDVVSIRADRGLGNIIVAGIIGEVVANADGRDVPGVFEGINGPIYSINESGSSSAASSGGRAALNYVQIGEGLASSGSGGFAKSGLYSDYLINQVTNQGSGSDIRGNIISGNYINSISLNNGSIIDANIQEVSVGQFALTRETSNTISIPTDFGLTQKVNQLGSINISGNGGIIGAYITAANIGPINVGGFGILSTVVSTLGQARIGQVTAAGYGIRDSVFYGGASFTGFNATGNGSNLPTYKVSPSVRQSDFVSADPVFGLAFDSYSGRALLQTNDLNAELGTSALSPVINGVTDTGVLENLIAVGQRDLGTVTAQKIRGDTFLHFGTQIGTIKTRGLIDGLSIITGKIGTFAPASDVLGLNMQVSGKITSIKINGSLSGNSLIQTIGANGSIGTITIKRDLVGTIHSSGTIGTITIGRNLTGSLIIDALNRSGLALGTLKVGGTISQGSLQVGSAVRVADVGTISVGGNLGASAADSMHITGSIRQLTVGGAINLALTVDRNAGIVKARSIYGPITTGGNFTSLTASKGGLNGALTVDGMLAKADITGGVTANISATNGIGTLTVYSGDVAAGTSISSDFGKINSIQVIHGSLNGNVFANAGTIGQIVVGGNVGDGSTAESITTRRLSLLSVGGSIRDGVTVRIAGPLDSLIVGGNIEAGAQIIAATLPSQRIGGQVFGSLLIG